MPEALGPIIHGNESMAFPRPWFETRWACRSGAVFSQARVTAGSEVISPGDGVCRLQEAIYRWRINNSAMPTN